jgi:hypothetical protein
MSIELAKRLERTSEYQPRRVYAGYFKLKQHKPWLDEGSEILDQRNRISIKYI